MDHPKINGRYNIIKTLGKGGMGYVYLAEDKANSNRLTAIKTIKAKFLKKPGSIQLFKHEYDIMSKLCHPNLARVYDFGEIDQGLYLTMEFVNGRELKSIIKEKEKLELEEALSIMVELLRAMEFVHSRNIIYSDIKPQNILITEKNEIKLIDFGLSDFDNNDVNVMIKGTLAYMPPEVLTGTAKDHRADIFSLGVLFYEILTGVFLFKDILLDSILKTMCSVSKFNFILQESLLKLDCNPAKEIIEKMCAYYAKDRFFSCSEVIFSINTKLNKQFLFETEETKEAFVVGIPFTGRERELKYLEKSVNSTEYKLFLIMGDQGIGKSRLLKEFEKWCNLNGIIYISGNSVKGISYEPFMTIVSNVLFYFAKQISDQQKKYLKFLLPDHSSLSYIPVQTKELFGAKTLKDVLVTTISSIIINFAIESSKKVIMVFENLNNADEISLEIIAEILYQIKQNKIIDLKLFAECRSEEHKQVSAFIKKLKEIDRLKVLKLQEFSETEVKQYIENSFGKKFIDKTLFSKISNIYEFCGGNPLFLQELIKSMVSDNFINKDKGFWQFSGSFSNIKPGNNLMEIIHKKIRDLKLSDNYYNAMIFMSFSANEKFYINFYHHYAENEFNINWQDLFDLLLRKELLQLENDYYITPNKLYKEAIHSMLSPEEIVHQHKIWVKILEQQLTPDFEIEGLSDKLLYNLSYHYYNCKFIDLEVFLFKTARFLFESGEREKAKYSNIKAIFYFSKLLREIQKFDSMQNADANDILQTKLKTFRNLSSIYETTGEWDKAIFYSEQSICIAKKLQDEILTGECNCDLGWVVLNKGRYNDAMVLLNESKTIALKEKNKKLYSMAIGNIGTLYSYQGDYLKSMECYEEKRKICLELGDKQGYSDAVGNMGILYSYQGDYAKSMECFKEDKKICSELGDKRNYSVAVGNIGILCFYQGNYIKAMSCYEEKRKICLELGDKRGYSTAVGNMGVVWEDQGEYAKAMECYEEKRKICLELGDKRGYSIAIANMGNIYSKQGIYSMAMECYVEAVNIGNELKIKYLLCSYLHLKAGIHFILKEYDNARTINQEAKSLANEVQSIDLIFDCSILCNKLLALNNKEGAVDHLARMLKSENNEENQALINYEIYKIKHSKIHHQKALKLYQRLYNKIPKYFYKKKLEELSKLTGDMP